MIAGEIGNARVDCYGVCRVVSQRIIRRNRQHICFRVVAIVDPPERAGLKDTSLPSAITGSLNVTVNRRCRADVHRVLRRHVGNNSRRSYIQNRQLGWNISNGVVIAGGQITLFNRVLSVAFWSFAGKRASD